MTRELHSQNSQQYTHTRQHHRVAVSTSVNSQSSPDPSSASVKTVMGKETVPKLRNEAPDYKAVSKLQPICCIINTVHHITQYMFKMQKHATRVHTHIN